MTKDVLITISGSQVTDGENSDVEMIIAGTYYLKNGKHYVTYEEVMEGYGGVVRNTIKIQPDSMDIIKTGQGRDLTHCPCPVFQFPCSSIIQIFPNF